jgi:hypothetical protein
MRETRSSGSVRGASGDGRPYRERVSPIASGRGDGLLPDHRAGAQPQRQELVFMPLKRPCRGMGERRSRVETRPSRFSRRVMPML